MTGSAAGDESVGCARTQGVAGFSVTPTGMVGVTLVQVEGQHQ